MQMVSLKDSIQNSYTQKKKKQQQERNPETITSNVFYPCSFFSLLNWQNVAVTETTIQFVLYFHCILLMTYIIKAVYLT